MRIQRTILMVAALFLAAAACRAQQAAPEPKGFSFTKVDLDLLDRSNQLDKVLQEKGLVFNDTDTTKYLTQVGLAVLPKGPELSYIHWQFFVLRDPIPNAFALPNGSIYVHSGLLAVLENEAQLAAVLAHEETHALNRHGYLENRNYRRKAETGMIAAGVVSAGGIAGEAVTGFYLAPAVITVQLTVPSLLESTLNGYGRELEEEADTRAVHALADASYSTAEMQRLFEVLREDHDVDLTKASFYKDHPKLKDREIYAGKLAASLPPPSGSAAVEADRYLIETESAVRHDAELEIRAGRARTAVWVMERILKRDDKLADNFYILGEAYRGLGARTPEPKPEELTSKGKEEARKKLSQMTPQEYEKALVESPGGHQTLESNERFAEKNYEKAGEISPELPGPHKGLGYLYEQENKAAQSAVEFRKYLELDSSAVDAPQIRRRIAEVEGSSGSSQPAGRN
jgi:beta-barrel assembly-enhancing protease